MSSIPSTGVKKWVWWHLPIIQELGGKERREPTCATLPDFTWVWGFELRSSFLCCRCLTHWLISPAQACYSVKLFLHLFPLPKPQNWVKPRIMPCSVSANSGHSVVQAAFCSELTERHFLLCWQPYCSSFTLTLEEKELWWAWVPKSDTD